MSRSRYFAKSRDWRFPRLRHFSKRQIDALPAQQRMLAIGERRDAVKGEPRRPAEHHRVARRQPERACRIGPFVAADPEQASVAERERDHRRGEVLLAGGYDGTNYFASADIYDPATGSWTVTGNLTLHGVTKQISFPANINVTADSVDIAAEFAINRLDFDIKYPGMPNDLIRKEVVLRLKVKATPAKA